MVAQTNHKDMGFKRHWDESCPRVWDTWEADGQTWTVQDLPPEDEERAVRLMLTQFCSDETLCSTLGVDKDPTCLSKMGNLWRASLSQRMSLACYKSDGGDRTLVAFNICLVICIGDEEISLDQEKDDYYQFLKTVKYLYSKCNVFEDLGVDKYLNGLGMLVTRENRGFKLGTRLLAAREPMCHTFGITATSTLFTGVASQKMAVRCGFTTNLEVTLRELAQNGMNYPADDDRAVMIMSKIYS